MNIFVTGATGFIGSQLTQKLAEKGNIVHALYRSKRKAQILRHPNIRLFKGDILDPSSLMKAVEGCEQVYHVAAFASVWEKDHSRIYHLNIEGAMNVLRASIKAGVKKILITSTAGVLGPSGNEPNDESARPDIYFIDYEHSKSILESIIRTICMTGINIVMVNPTRVYGPGLMSDSNGVTRMIRLYIKGLWRIIPGNGKSVGNYAFIDDVIDGHIQAMEKGKSGQRYILGGENASFDDFFRIVKKVTGKNRILLRIPVSLLVGVAQLMLLWAKISGKSPLITPALMRKYSHNYKISTSKAEQEIGYEVTGLEEGTEKTVKWLREFNF